MFASTGPSYALPPQASPLDLDLDLDFLGLILVIDSSDSDVFEKLAEHLVLLEQGLELGNFLHQFVLDVLDSFQILFVELFIQITLGVF